MEYLIVFLLHQFVGVYSCCKGNKEIGEVEFYPDLSIEKHEIGMQIVLGKVQFNLCYIVRAINQPLLVQQLLLKWNWI